MSYTREKSLETLLVIILGLTVFYFIYDQSLLLYIGFGLGVLSLIWSKVSLAITRLWYGLSNILGKVMSTLLLSLLFYGFLVPIALMYRAFQSNNPLQLKKSNTTYYSERDHVYSAQDLENPW